MFKNKKEKFMKAIRFLWAKMVSNEEIMCESHPLVFETSPPDFTDTRLLLEHAGIPRESSIECAKEYIEKGKTSCIINRYGDAVVCMIEDDTGNFLYRVERNEFK